MPHFETYAEAVEAATNHFVNQDEAICGILISERSAEKLTFQSILTLTTFSCTVTPH